MSLFITFLPLFGSGSFAEGLKAFCQRFNTLSWPVWRIICPPASGAMLGQSLTRQTGGEAIYDWAGGLIWLALPPYRVMRFIPL